MKIVFTKANEGRSSDWATREREEKADRKDELQETAGERGG